MKCEVSERRVAIKVIINLMILIVLIHLAKFLEVASDSYYKELILRLKFIKVVW